VPGLPPRRVELDAEESALGEPAEVSTIIVTMNPTAEVEDNRQLVLARDENQQVVAVDVDIVCLVQLCDLCLGSFFCTGGTGIELAGSLGFGEASFDFF
jgi:hypothetical protein